MFDDPDVFSWCRFSHNPWPVASVQPLICCCAVLGKAKGQHDSIKLHMTKLNILCIAHLHSMSACMWLYCQFGVHDHNTLADCKQNLLSAPAKVVSVCHWLCAATNSQQLNLLLQSFCPTELLLGTDNKHQQQQRRSDAVVAPHVKNQNCRRH